MKVRLSRSVHLLRSFPLVPSILHFLTNSVVIPRSDFNSASAAWRISLFFFCQVLFNQCDEPSVSLHRSACCKIHDNCLRSGRPRQFQWSWDILSRWTFWTTFPCASYHRSAVVAEILANNFTSIYFTITLRSGKDGRLLSGVYDETQFVLDNRFQVT